MSFRLSFIALASVFALSTSLPAMAQDAHASAEHAVTVGTIAISAPFTRATLPNAPVAGGFMTLTNTGAEEDRLVSAESAIAKETQIHEMSMEGDVMKMRQLPDGVVIAAGETVTLEPGSFHLMFMGIGGQIKEGDVVPVTLTFEKAGSITVDLVAGGTAADAPAHSGMKH